MIKERLVQKGVQPFELGFTILQAIFQISNPIYFCRANTLATLAILHDLMGLSSKFKILKFFILFSPIKLFIRFHLQAFLEVKSCGDLAAKQISSIDEFIINNSILQILNTKKARYVGLFSFLRKGEKQNEQCNIRIVIARCVGLFSFLTRVEFRRATIIHCFL